MKYALSLAALISLGAAQSSGGIPTVVITTTPCAGSNSAPQTFNVAVNTVGSVKIDAQPLCGLTLTSSSSLPISSITCQAFKDDAGTQSGSAQFTAQKPALISTTPVGIKSVVCRNAQFNGSSSSSVGVSASATSTVTLGAPVTTGTTLPSPVAVPTGNVTVGNGTPGYNGTQYTGEGVMVGAGGSVVGMVVGVLAAALVV